MLAAFSTVCNEKNKTYYETLDTVFVFKLWYIGTDSCEKGKMEETTLENGKKGNCVQWGGNYQGLSSTSFHVFLTRQEEFISNA